MHRACVAHCPEAPCESPWQCARPRRSSEAGKATVAETPESCLHGQEKRAEREEAQPEGLEVGIGEATRCPTCRSSKQKQFVGCHEGAVEQPDTQCEAQTGHEL